MLPSLASRLRSAGIAVAVLGASLLQAIALAETEKNRRAAEVLGTSPLQATPLLHGSPPQAASGTVIRAVALGLRHGRGEVRMSLFEAKRGFPDKPEHSLQRGKGTMAADSATCVFAPLPPGRYAVAAFHDEDGDGKMRRDFVGRPREGWGVSRDAKARFGPPRFDAAAFEARGDTFTVRLRLRY